MVREEGGKKDFSTPTFQHVPLSCPFLVTVTMSFQSESAATSAPASCQIMEFSLMPNYGVVRVLTRLWLELRYLLLYSVLYTRFLEQTEGMF